MPFSTVQSIFADITPIVSTRQLQPKSCHLIIFVKFIELACKTANINGKKLFSLKPVVRTQRSYKRVGIIKRQKLFKGHTMYGHEVLVSLETQAKLFGTHFLHCYVSDIRLW
jgi:hypothetical protein